MANEHAEEQAMRRLLTLRIVAPLTFLTFLNSLDRVNVSFAALQMNTEVGLDPKTYGTGVGLFFFAYLTFQLPHTLVLRKIGARLWIFGAVLFWGVVASAMASVRTPVQFYALRFLLGVAEAGFAPGIIYYMSQWMPSRFRAWAVAGSMLAIPISVVIGGPLSGWLLTQPNPFGMSGWRWMFLIEGLPTIATAFVALRYFVDTPAQARWLSPERKAWLLAQLADEKPDAQHAAGGMQLLRSVRVWSAAGVWFSLMCGAYGIIFWLPQMIKQLSGAGDMQVSMLSALPWVGLGMGMMINARHSDRTQERYLHIGIPALVAAAGLTVSSSVTSGWLALVWLVVAGAGLGAAQGAFWALPTSFLSGASAAIGITLINILGSSGGLVAPPAIGFIRAHTGSFSLAVYALSGLLALGALLLVPIYRLREDAPIARELAQALPGHGRTP